MGFVFQHYALFRHMSVFENVAFGLRVRPRRERLGREAIAARVRHLLDLVQLPGLEGRYPHQLSGGQRQRVALARALAVEPRVLLLDEPFGALDAKVRKELRRWLRRFHDEIGLTTLFVTHDQEEALEIADEVVVMDQGRIEQVGTPAAVYDRPASPFVHQFIGNVNVLRSSGLREWGAPEAAVRDGRFFVRPQDIEVIGPGATEGAPAVVRHVNAAGPQARLTLEHVVTREFLEAEISRAELSSLGLKTGDIVRLRLRQVRFFDEGYSI
jgi:sulfate transport system ATP-binding protein